MQSISFEYVMNSRFPITCFNNLTFSSSVPFLLFSFAESPASIFSFGLSFTESPDNRLFFRFSTCVLKIYSLGDSHKTAAFGLSNTSRNAIKDFPVPVGWIIAAFPSFLNKWHAAL